jgi:prolyl oligopeptidase
MRRFAPACSGLLLAACAAQHTAAPVPAAPPATALRYPASPRGDAVDRLHGAAVPDPWRWLEDEKAPEVQAWMASQDRLARDFLGGLPGRAALASRLRELVYVESMGLPVKRGPRIFFERRAATEEKAALWVREADGAERRLLDPGAWSRDGSVALGAWSVSWDGRTVAYQVKPNAADMATLRVLDVPSGKVSDVDVIEGARYAYASFTPGGDGFYYTWIPTDPRIPDADRPGYQEVRFHRLGTDPAKDLVVRERLGDPTTFLHAEVSRDGRWLFLFASHGWSSTDVWFRDARRGPAEPLRPLAVGRKHIYQVTAHRDRFYVRTNDGAPRWRVMGVDPARPEREAWREVVPEGEGTLRGLEVVGGRLALAWMERAQSRLEIRDLEGRRLGDVALPGLGTASLPSGEEDDDQAFFSFESFTAPPEVRELRVSSRASRLVFRLAAPVDPSRYEVEQVFYRSRDGTRVSMFLVHARGARPDGSAPVMLYGYGGFQQPMLPVFSAPLHAWLERGGVFALPNLRGGNEYGERWHEEGMLLKKQNVFDDFVAAAEWLVREGWAGKGRIVLRGGSNGGLLVGAAMTQRPDLFAAVLCAVPLLDMVRYHLFGSGKTWISEYGSADDPAQFAALHAYSPYHRVAPGTAYPWLLLDSADHDDRVDPMHARKFAAAVQAATRGGPALLRIERNAGHSGADLLRATVERRADEYAFALAALGIRSGG